MTTAACKAFLETFDSEWLRASELATGLKRGTWSRTRKYIEPSGLECRDFANKGVPAVVTLLEGPTKIVVLRERGMGMWEREFAAFESWYDNGPKANLWEERMLWPSLRAEDFAFGVSTEEMEGHAFFFQPKTLPKSEFWDQHSPIDHLFHAIGLDGGGEVCESTYVFTRDGQENFDATALLLAAGFTHDKKLDGIVGS